MAEVQNVSADHPKCDDCGAPATHSYTWEWGQSGFCCAVHQAVRQQQSASLNRSVSFAVVSSTATAPLQREERVRLVAETIVVKEELAEAKARGLQLYDQNQNLTRQLQAVTTQYRECEELRKDAVAAAEPLRQQLEDTRAKLADAVDELGRLRVLVAIPPLPESDAERTIGG